MITSHLLLQNSRLCSTNAHHCLRPRIAALLRSSDDLRFDRALGFEIRSHLASQKSHRVSVSTLFSGSRFSVAARASMEIPAVAADANNSKPEAPKADPIVQYIVLRKDLVDTLKWPLGSVISQGCHAAVAAIVLHRDDPSTAEYCGMENLDNMHTVTLEVKGETQLRNLAQKLEAGGVAHKLWIEQLESGRWICKADVRSDAKNYSKCRGMMRPSLPQAAVVGIAPYVHHVLQDQVWLHG